MCGAVWLTMEQVATAALDCRALPLAASIIAQICDKFPGSLRAARMMVRCPALAGHACGCAPTWRADA